MKLFLVKRRNECSFEEFDSFICAANNIDDALNIHPNYDHTNPKYDAWDDDESIKGGGRGWRWVGKGEKEKLQAVQIGESKIDHEQVILASFNAG